MPSVISLSSYPVPDAWPLDPYCLMVKLHASYYRLLRHSPWKFLFNPWSLIMNADRILLYQYNIHLQEDQLKSASSLDAYCSIVKSYCQSMQATIGCFSTLHAQLLLNTWCLIRNADRVFIDQQCVHSQGHQLKSAISSM